MADDPVLDALAAARELLVEAAARDAGAVTAAIPSNEDSARDHPADAAALLAMDTPAGRAFGLRVLARLEPARAAPLARAVTVGLLGRANERRTAYMRAADPEIVEACIAEADTVVVGLEVDAPPGERRVLRPLRAAAKTLEDVIALVGDRHDGRSWHALWSLVGRVFQRTEGGKYDVMGAITRERRAQEGLDPMDAATLRQARAALPWCVPSLPFDDVDGLLERGVIALGDDAARRWVERAELESPDACLERLERSIQFDPGMGAFLAGDEPLVRALMKRLGALAHAPAARAIARLLLTPGGRLGEPARDAIARLPADVARASLADALQEVVDRRWLALDPHHPQRHVVAGLEALLSIPGTDAFEVTAPFFTPERLAIGPGACLVLQLLSLVRGRFAGKPHAVIALLDRPIDPPRALTEDDRWLGRVVGLLGHRILAAPAWAALGSFDPKRRERAIQDAIAAAPPRPAPVVEVAAETDRAAEETMRTFLASLEALVPKLRKLKVALPPKAKLRVAPKPTIDADLQKLEKKIRVRLPAALRAFYRIVGSVDLAGPGVPTPRTFGGVPLVIYPFRDAAGELVAAVTAHKPIPEALRPPLSFTLGPEMPRARVRPYGDDRPMVCLLSHADPPLLGAPCADGRPEGGAPTFEALLQEALRGAGFIGATAAPKGI